jgi:hypothetical protein
MSYKEIPPLNQNLLTQAIERYKREPFNPELVTNYWRAKLQADGVMVAIKFLSPFLYSLNDLITYADCSSGNRKSRTKEASITFFI